MVGYIFVGDPSGIWIGTSPEGLPEGGSGMGVSPDPKGRGVVGYIFVGISPEGKADGAIGMGVSPDPSI